MLEKLKTLHTLLGPEGFILTGSTALAYHGLLQFDEAKDLDIILVTPNEAAIAILDKFQAASPSPKFKVGGCVNYSFIFEGVKVDIWIVGSINETKCFNEDGIRIATIRHIVAAKQNIGRSKDWIQLMQLANKIFDKKAFEGQLSSIGNHSNDYSEVE